MKYFIDGTTIRFSTTTFPKKEFKLEKSAFDEAPFAEYVEIKNRRGEILRASAMKVLTSVTETIATRGKGIVKYRVPVEIFREVV